jgi:hypothetical protein
MPRIRCRYIGCVYLEDGLCSAPIVELDPEEGCLTFSRESDPFDEDWDEEEEEFEEWEDEDLGDDDWFDIEDDY